MESYILKASCKHKSPVCARQCSFAGVHGFSHMPYLFRNYLSKTLWKNKQNEMSYAEYSIDAKIQSYLSYQSLLLSLH